MRIIILLILLSPFYHIQSQTVGTIQNDPASFNGYTLFSPNADTNTYLIDNCGQLINSWKSNYNPGLSAYLLEDGSLLRTCQLNNPTFSLGGRGGRVERYDWDGNLVWEFNFSNNQYCQHHDIEYLPNGNILILATEKKTQLEAVLEGRDPNLLQEGELWAEFLVEIKPVGADSGTIVWEWHSWDHLVQNFDSTKNNYQAQTNIPNKFNLNYIGNNSKADWMHANAIDYNPTLDQIVITSKKWSELWIIDHSTTSLEASGPTGGNSGMGGDILYRWGNPITYGQNGQKFLYDPHDVHWIDSGKVDAGKLMIFNNGKNRGWSTVDIISTPVDSNGNYSLSGSIYGPSAIEWSYADPTPTNFYAQRISGAQRLENGNTLICDGPDGYFFEIDSAQQKVWEYINPVTNSGIISQGQSSISGNNVFRAYRYSPEYAAFDGRTLSPGSPIELNPVTGTCSIYTGLEISAESFQEAFSIYPNPFTNQIQIDYPNFKQQQVCSVYNLLGELVYVGLINSSTTSLSLDNLPKSSYIFKIESLKAQILIKN